MKATGILIKRYIIMQMFSFKYFVLLIISVFVVYAHLLRSKNFPRKNFLSISLGGFLRGFLFGFIIEDLRTGLVTGITVAIINPIIVCFEEYILDITTEASAYTDNQK